MPEDSGTKDVALEATAEAPAKSAPVASDSGKRIPELDGLRGVAILLVVLFHGFFFAPGPDYHPADLIHRLYFWFERFIAIGWTGVDLFFVLSGFLIGGILLDARESPRFYRTFYLRRFFRIIPPYYAWLMAYVLVTLTAGAFLAAHSLKGNTPSGRVFLWMQFLFLQNLGILDHYPTVAGAWLRPTWSLAVEEQFYLITPTIIKTLSRRALAIFLAAVVMLADTKNRRRDDLHPNAVPGGRPGNWCPGGSGLA
jgi:peptidoglycan/LPS O-acetylase OafA/YrhL